jgi:hypothetical protein
MEPINRALQVLDVQLADSYVHSVGLEVSRVVGHPLPWAEAPELRHDLSWIGDDYGTNLCTDAAGSLLSIPSMAGQVRRFVNSSAYDFVKCLTVFGAWVERVAPENDFAEPSGEEPRASVAGLRKMIAEVDPAALGDRENWWAVIVEQIAGGML